MAVITYRKNVKDQWPESDFSEKPVETEGAETTMALAEKPTELDKVVMREIRRLSKNGHQTSMLTTNPILTIIQVAIYMASRWSQENFFRYMRQNYYFDRIAQYTVNQIDNDILVINPAYNKLDYQIRKTREKIARRKAKLYILVEKNVKSNLDYVRSGVLNL